jgi:hypothetical protein
MQKLKPYCIYFEFIINIIIILIKIESLKRHETSRHVTGGLNLEENNQNDKIF